MDTSNNPDSNTPTFNSGLGIIDRINKARAQLDQFIMQDDWDNWTDALRVWWIEIDFKLSEEERIQIAKELDKAMTLRGNRDQILLKILQNLSLKLSRLQHKYKLGMPEQDNEFKVDEMV